MIPRIHLSDFAATSARSNDDGRDQMLGNVDSALRARENLKTHGERVSDRTFLKHIDEYLKHSYMHYSIRIHTCGTLRWTVESLPDLLQVGPK